MKKWFEDRWKIPLRLVLLLAMLAGRDLDICGQAIKGAWGMSWHWKAMKGVEVCDMPGVVDKQALIPGFLNERLLNT